MNVIYLVGQQEGVTQIYLFWGSSCLGAGSWAPPGWELGPGAVLAQEMMLWRWSGAKWEGSGWRLLLALLWSSAVCWACQPKVLLVTITNKKPGFLAVATGEEVGIVQEYWHKILLAFKGGVWRYITREGVRVAAFLPSLEVPQAHVCLCVFQITYL